MSFTLGPFEALEAGLFSSKPNVPQFNWIDLAQQQLDTTKGNLGVLPQAEELGGQVNSFMRGERAKTLAGIPGLSDLESLQLGNLKSWLKGELPADVASQVQRHANSQAFAGGYGGSGMAGNLSARDLGLTSLQLSQSAMPMANQFAQNEYAMRATPEFNPASMFVDPMSAAKFNAGQQSQQWNRDWLANRIASQPEPWQQSLMNSTQQAGAIGDSLFASYLGSMTGGAGASAASNMMIKPTTPANQGYDSTYSPYPPNYPVV